MARSIIGKDKFQFNDIFRNYTGEYLNDRLKYLYLFLPKATLVSAFFCFFFALLHIAVLTKFFFLLTFFLLTLVCIFTYMMHNERSDVASIGVINEARDTQLETIFSKNRKRIKYYAHVGTCVHEFLGKDDKESLKLNLIPSNKKYEMLIPKKIYTMGYLMPGATGSGKTATLNTTVFLPAIKSGNGFFYIEGKGERDITEAILGFIYQYGRENDVYILDFGAAANGGYTNGLNPLAIGSAKTVGELLKNLIDIMKGDNKWVSDMAIAFLEAILLPLVLLRDMNLIVDPTELKSIQTYSDFNNKEIKLFNITTLLNYLNFQAAIDLYYMMNRMFKDREFVKHVKQLDEYSNLKKSLKENITDRLMRNLTGHNIDLTSLTEPDYSKIPGDVKKNHPKATEDWINALEIFGSEKYYGNIFNKDEADITSLTAIQTGKMIIAIIPTMSASPEQCSKMGKMLTSITKSSIGYMLEKGDLTGKRRDKRRDKRYRPRKLPYGFVFDEPGNYANEDISQESSMIRSIGSDGGGMALVWTGQSRTDADRIDEGKKIESERLLANLGFTQCLNIQDKGWKELMVEKTGEHYVRRENEFDGKRSNEDDNYREIRREKEKKYELNYFENNLRPQTGESIVIMKGNPNEEKLVAGYNVAPVSDMLLNKNISSKKLFSSFKSIDESNKELELIKAELNENIEKSFKRGEGLDKTFEQEVKDALILLGTTAYPALNGIDTFTLSLKSEDNPRAHGDYTYSTRHINIYNSLNKSREHLIATAVHELCHHIEFLETGTSGHSKNFYRILHEMLGYAMGLEELGFDYEEAKSKKMVDCNDIRMLEKYFGKPKLKEVAA
jgi:hypothetical protein